MNNLNRYRNYLTILKEIINELKVEFGDKAAMKKAFQIEIWLRTKIKRGNKDE